MAAFLAAKAPTEVVERRWTVPVDDCDSPASASLAASGITVDANEFEGDELVLTLSAGTAGATGSVVATITTSEGRTLVETLYIPVVVSSATAAHTARDYCYFALRKLAGLGEDPTASELDDAMEQLSGLIAAWREEGADIGCPFPLTAASVIYCPDWAVDAIRYNLRLSVYSTYGEEPTPMDAMNARRGLALVKNHNIQKTRLPEPVVDDY